MKFLNTPIAGLLNTIYSLIGNYGISIIVFTIIVRMILFPLSVSQRRNMETQKKLQPKINELRKKYGNDPQTMMMKQNELFKEHGHNPLSGCLPLLIQFPIIIALFGVLRNAHQYLPANALTQSFLWLSNMVDPDTLSNVLPTLPMADKLPGILPIIAAIFTYITSKTSMSQASATQDPDGPKMPNMSFMTYMFPMMILMFGATYSAGLILYWATSNIVQFFQDRLLNQMFKNKEVS